MFIHVYILILDLNWIPFSHQLKPTKTHLKRQCLQMPCLSPKVKVQMASVTMFLLIVVFSITLLFFKYEFDLLSLVLSLHALSRSFLSLTFSSSKVLAAHDNNFILELSSLLICFCRLILLLKLRWHHFANFLILYLLFKNLFSSASTQLQEKDVQHFLLAKNF